MALNLKNNLLNNKEAGKKEVLLSRKYISLGEDLSRCTRCGACLQGCLIYKTRNMENFSPRGLVQLLNYLVERKIDIDKNEEMLLKCINSCAQCGQCSKFCAAGLRVDSFIFSFKSSFIKPSFRMSYLKFYQKYSTLLFPLFSFARKIKQTKKEEVKNLLLTSKAGLKFASASLALLPASRVLTQGIYLNEAIYKSDRKLLKIILKGLKKEIGTFNQAELFTDNIILWRYLKKEEDFKNIKLLIPTLNPAEEKAELYIINNNSFENMDKDLLYSCLNANFFVEFTQDTLHTPANMFWRSLSVEEEQILVSALKRYERTKLLALCAEDKVFYEKLKKKYRIKLNIYTLAQLYK